MSICCLDFLATNFYHVIFWIVCCSCKFRVASLARDMHSRTSTITSQLDTASVQSSIHTRSSASITIPAVHTLDAQPPVLTDHELVAVLTTQVMWLADIVCSHVRDLPSDDLADEAERRLMQARGQWLVNIPNPMEVPLQQLLCVLYPVWTYLLNRYSGLAS